MTTNEMIATADKIEIISGEVENGTVEEYDGKRTARAIKSRLTKERCDGDRWAKVRIDGRDIDL